MDRSASPNHEPDMDELFSVPENRPVGPGGLRYLLALAFFRHTECRCRRRRRRRRRCGFDGGGNNHTGFYGPPIMDSKAVCETSAAVSCSAGSARDRWCGKAEISISTTSQVMSPTKKCCCCCQRLHPLYTSRLRRRGRVDSKHREHLMLDAIIRARPPCQSKLDGLLVNSTSQLVLLRESEG